MKGEKWFLPPVSDTETSWWVTAHKNQNWEEQIMFFESWVTCCSQVAVLQTVEGQTKDKQIIFPFVNNSNSKKMKDRDHWYPHWGRRNCRKSPLQRPTLQTADLIRELLCSLSFVHWLCREQGIYSRSRNRKQKCSALIPASSMLSNLSPNQCLDFPWMSLRMRASNVQTNSSDPPKWTTFFLVQQCNKGITQLANF